MWYRWIWWQMSAQSEWLDEMGNPSFIVWVSVNPKFLEADHDLDYLLSIPDWTGAH